MTRTVSMSTAINEAMKISMRRDENVILIGEDVAGGDKLITCKMMKLGVVFLVLRKDLYKSLGRNRILDTPISEAGYMGAAIQLAQLGYVR